MRRCEWIVSPPSKRIIRCLPCASTARTPRPASFSGQWSLPKRGWGVSIDSISWPTSAPPTRFAAVRIVSPSGMARPLRRQRQLARSLPEAKLDQELLRRGPDYGFAVEALDGELANAALAHVVGQRF